MILSLNINSYRYTISICINDIGMEEIGGAMILTDIVGSSELVFSSDGELVFREIDKLLQEGVDKVVISFLGASTVTSCFLNNAIGQLLERYSPAFIGEHIILQDIDSDIKHTLRLVVDRAKEYYGTKRTSIQDSEEEEGR